MFTVCVLYIYEPKHTHKISSFVCSSSINHHPPKTITTHTPSPHRHHPSIRRFHHPTQQSTKHKMSSDDELIQIVIQESTNTQQQLERDQLNAAILASQAEQERVRREKEKEERSLSRSGDVASYYEDSILISNSTFVNHVLRLVRRFVKCLPIHINQSINQSTTTTTTTDEIKE